MAKKPTRRQIAAQQRLIIVALRDRVPEELIREAFFDRNGEPIPDYTWSRRLSKAIDDNAAALAANPCNCHVHVR